MYQLIKPSLNIESISKWTTDLQKFAYESKINPFGLRLAVFATGSGNNNVPPGSGGNLTGI